MNRVVAHWAFLPSYQDHFRTEFRTEANFSQKLQPSVDTQHNTTERTNRKWSNNLFHLCGIHKPQELTLELEAWCFCPLGVLPFPLLLINKHFRGKNIISLPELPCFMQLQLWRIFSPSFLLCSTLLPLRQAHTAAFISSTNNCLNPQLNNPQIIN